MASILMLTPQVPYPPRQGTALRNWGLLRGLAAHHRVSLLSFVAPDQAREVPPTLAHYLEQSALVPQPVRTLRQRLHDLLLSRQPDLVRRLYARAFADQLASWLHTDTFDWVLVEGLELAPYLAQVWVLGDNRPRVVFDDHNCEYVLQRRAALQHILAVVIVKDHARPVVA
ncbi:MAG TPA: glycosyl transferase family 1, partial [Chloroflexi bacterium]|nr:glycosyl transferase family 1 [Chloroflexota bacterium]